jgi:hypothetical protein
MPKDMTVFFVGLLFPLCTGIVELVSAIQILIPSVLFVFTMKYYVSTGHARQPFIWKSYTAVTFLRLGIRWSLVLKSCPGRLIPIEGASINHRIVG